MELSGKIAVVTGASMGIGEAIAGLFASQGASVVLLSRDAGRAEAARHRIGHTERTLALACDVRHREEIDRVLSLTLHHFDRLDIWVNNAGHGLLDAVASADTRRAVRVEPSAHPRGGSRASVPGLAFPGIAETLCGSIWTSRLQLPASLPSGWFC